MLKPVPFANAFTVVGVGVYIVCRMLSLIAPDLLFSIGQSWFHTINLGSVKATSSMDLGTFLLGGLSVGVLVWVSSYLVAYFYNRFSK